MEHMEFPMSFLPPLRELLDVFTSQVYHQAIHLMPRMFYHINLVLSLVTCSDNNTKTSQVLKENYIKYSNEEDDQESFSLVNFVSSFLGYHTLDQEQTQEEVKDPDTLSYSTESCNVIFSFEVDQHFPVQLICVIVLASVTLLCIFILLTFIFERFKCHKDAQTIPTDENKYADFLDSEHISQNGCATKSNMEEQEYQTKQKESQPLIIQNRLPTHHYFLTNRDVFDQFHVDVLSNTVERFLKELDVKLHSWPLSEFKTLSSSLSSSSDYVSSLTSPKLPRRTLPQNRFPVSARHSVSGSRPVDNQNSTKTWIAYEQFKGRLKWVYHECNLDSINISQVSKGDIRLMTILQFLHQTCPINPRQWDIATSVVNYTLFLVETELKRLCQITQDFIQISKFECSGSAADGTIIGSADRFDVLLVLDLPLYSELMMLHNNVCANIPPGHIIIGAKENCISKHGLNYSRKSCIQGVSGMFLQTHLVVERIDALLKKAILKLKNEHKKRLESLPFTFQMSPTKKLTMCLDTHLLHGLGLGIGEINIKITPAINMPISRYCMLPPLFAVPRKINMFAPQPSKGPLTKLKPKQGLSDLLWVLHTERLQWHITEDVESRFLRSGVKSIHRECLMVLKALFSSANHNLLLNKGEIDSYILHTVVAFLLHESPAHAWSLEQIAVRVSDCIHFLKSAFENNWLPEFCVHNPHLLKKIPALRIFDFVLKGRQRNLLANVTHESAMKVLDYMSHRLQETKLESIMQELFSSDLWEYEFFIFG